MSAGHALVWLTREPGQDTNECESEDEASSERTERRLLGGSHHDENTHARLHFSSVPLLLRTKHRMIT